MRKETIYFATSYNKSSINGFATHAKLLPWKFFSELHVPRVSYCINFIIFRAIDQPVLIKLALTQPEIVAGAKATFPKHEYFSSEDLNLRKPKKFS